jgi:hypothetical protein
MTVCAPAWSFQKSGAAALFSMRVSSSSGRATSKIAPQISSALAEILVAPLQLVDCSHSALHLHGLVAHEMHETHENETQICFFFVSFVLSWLSWSVVPL